MKHRITIEQSLYLLAIVVGLGLRLYNLGAAPLTDAEASWALQALKVAEGEAPQVIGPQPGYVLLTGLLFWAFGASNFAARLLPALSGVLLVGLPYILRIGVRNLEGPGEQQWTEKLRLAGPLFAFGLALDPGLAALSRQAGSSMPAVGLGLAALALLWLRRPLLSGIFAGLALLMGLAVWQGALALALAWGAARLLRRNGLQAPYGGRDPWEAGDGVPAQPDGDEEALAAPTLDEERVVTPVEGNFRPGKGFWATFLVSAGVSLVLAGTLFLRYPSGLSAWASSFVTYLAGWSPATPVQATHAPALRLLAALPFYTPLALLFGLAGLVAAWVRPVWRSPENGILREAGLWFLFALILAVLYPARTMGDLAWALIPLWFLAAMQVVQLLSMKMQAAPTSPYLWISQALLIFILFGLFWQNLAGLSAIPAGSQAFTLRLGVMFGVVALAVLTTTLIGLGWSWEAAVRGLACGLGLALGAATFSAAWGATQLSPNTQLTNLNPRQELWSPGPSTVSPDLLVESLRDLGEWGKGWPTDVEIILAVQSPALEWALRDFPKVSLAGEVEASLRASGSEPDAVITVESAEAPSLAAAYRGQDFTWRILPTWTGALPDNLFPWWAFRQAPARIERVILWARADIFPGGEGQTSLP